MEPRRLMTIDTPAKFDDIRHAMRFYQYIVRPPDAKKKHRWLAFQDHQHLLAGDYHEADTEAEAMQLLLNEYRKGA